MLSGCDTTTPRALPIFFWCTTSTLAKHFHEPTRPFQASVVLPAAESNLIAVWCSALFLWDGGGEGVLASLFQMLVTCLVPKRHPLRSCITLAAFDLAAKSMDGGMDTLGIEPRASRMLNGCDTTTPRALKGSSDNHAIRCFVNKTA